MPLRCPLPPFSRLAAANLSPVSPVPYLQRVQTGPCTDKTALGMKFKGDKVRHACTACAACAAFPLFRWRLQLSAASGRCSSAWRLQRGPQLQPPCLRLAFAHSCARLLVAPSSPGF